MSVLQPNSALLSFVANVIKSPTYWGNTNFDALTLKDENAWVEEGGKPKGFSVVAKVTAAELGEQAFSKSFYIDLEQAELVGKDFNKTLTALHTAFRLKLSHPRFT
ncbi:hypothetical protein P7C70_g974, partial [Phenoliferia sp. Uapishka_3]